ncbi:MAG: hypothetical protein IGQ88_12945 [Gloeomargaritaceae cyanobacterium C42_A2020_066]|nr:hypothetical protein [Gloeomargaritaceae cyanobacterium C42_A2020_066]
MLNGFMAIIASERRKQEQRRLILEKWSQTTLGRPIRQESELTPEELDTWKTYLKANHRLLY